MTKECTATTYLGRKNDCSGFLGFETFNDQGGIVNSAVHMGPRLGTVVIPVVSIALAYLNYRTFRSRRATLSELHECREDILDIESRQFELDQVLTIRDDDFTDKKGWVTQSVMLAKFRFPTKRTAMSQVRQLGFSSEHMESSPNWYGFMQEDPGAFREWDTLDIGGPRSGIRYIRGLK